MIDKETFASKCQKNNWLMDAEIFYLRIWFDWLINHIEMQFKKI